MSSLRILAGIRYANRGYENGLEHAVLSEQMLPILRHPVSTRQNGQKWLKSWPTAGSLSRLWRQCGLELCDRLLTNGVSLLQTNKYNSTCWPYCPGHTLPPSGSKTCHPARNGGLHDHPRFYYRLILRGR